MTADQTAAMAWAKRAIDSGFAWAKHVRVLVGMIEEKNETFYSKSKQR